MWGAKAQGWRAERDELAVDANAWYFASMTPAKVLSNTLSLTELPSLTTMDVDGNHNNN